MNLTLQQIQSLPDKEKRQLKADVNYILSKEYSLHKRRKQMMRGQNNEHTGTEEPGHNRRMG